MSTRLAPFCHRTIGQSVPLVHREENNGIVWAFNERPDVVPGLLLCVGSSCSLWATAVQDVSTYGGRLEAHNSDDLRVGTPRRIAEGDNPEGEHVRMFSTGDVVRAGVGQCAESAHGTFWPDPAEGGEE